MPVYTREDEVTISVTLDGAKFPPGGGSWDSVAGGERDANTVKIRIGGREIDIGGPSSRGDLTVGIQMSDVVASWFRTFDSRSGKGAMNVSVSITDGDGRIVSGPFTYAGTLKTTTRPDLDNSNSSPGAAKFQAVMSCHEDMAG